VRGMDEPRERWTRLLASAPEERAGQPMRICRLCVDLVGVTGAGISMVTTTANRGVVCATDETAAEIEQLQLGLGEGPCVDAAQSHGPVLVGDLARPGDVVVDRWPTFLPHAEAIGVAAVFALPLRIGEIGVGVMDLYRDRPGDLDDEQLAFALLAADTAAVSLLQLGRDDDGEMRVERLAQSEVLIHQATGMVSAQLDVPVEEAFLLLRARAFTTDRLLADVARDVVELRLRFSPQEDA